MYAELSIIHVRMHIMHMCTSHVAHHMRTSPHVLLAEVLYGFNTPFHTHHNDYAGSGHFTPLALVALLYSTRLSKKSKLQTQNKRGHRYRLTSGVEGKRVRCSAWPPTSKRRNRLKPIERGGVAPGEVGLVPALQARVEVVDGRVLVFQLATYGSSPGPTSIPDPEAEAALTTIRTYLLRTASSGSSSCSCSCSPACSRSARPLATPFAL